MRCVVFMREQIVRSLEGSHFLFSCFLIIDHACSGQRQSMDVCYGQWKPRQFMNSSFLLWSEEALTHQGFTVK